jgi:hypothetical protein
MKKFPETGSIIAFNDGNVTYIDNTRFNVLSIQKRNEVMLFVASLGAMPLSFIDSFVPLMTKRTIIENIKEGKDVSLSLALLELDTVTPKMLTDLREARIQYDIALAPIVVAIQGMTSSYPFVTDAPSNSKPLTLISNGKKVSNGPHSMGIATAKRIFALAIKHWSAGRNSVTHAGYQSIDGYNRNPEIRKDFIEIGCQTIQRYDVEQFALAQGWDFDIV